LQPPFTEKIPVHLIDQPETLLHCLQDLGRSDTLSFDLEFDNNRFSYGVTLCLIQVATPQVCYVIDPLANLDLSELYALFESPGIQKIVHASGEDLRLLHSLGCYPKNVFDTEVAARLLNYEHTSLTVLLRDKLAFEMDKKEQKSNWLRRPLSSSQVQYAADDVLWLHPLKRVLEAEAGAKDLLPFLREEQELLSTTIYPSLSKTNFLKPSDQYTLSPREQYITNELLGYFHELARDINRPVYQIMRDEVVRSLAAGTRLPESIVQDQGVHPRLKNSRFVARLTGQLAQIRKAAAAQNLSDEKQRRPKLTPAEWAAVNKAANDREQVFAPIQQALVQRFGEHATKFLFSNKAMNSLLEGAISLQDIKPAYRQDLIRNIAAEAGIDLGTYDIDAAGRI
jgi:ribonuclease D